MDMWGKLVYNLCLVPRGPVTGTDHSLSRVSRSDYDIEFMVGGSPSNVFGEKVGKKRSTTKMEHGSANCA